MELKDTIMLMNSSDYKDRFKAEYYQTKIRYDKLNEMLFKLRIFKLRNGTLEFEPTCSETLLSRQLHHMRMYLIDLETRAKIEDIKLK